MNLKKLAATAACLVMLASAAPSWAHPIGTRLEGTAVAPTVPSADLKASVVVQEDNGYTGADKAIRGFFGLTLAALEVPGNMSAESRDNGLLYGLTVGLVKGVVAVPVRVGVSAVELVTAPFAVPTGYVPMLCPEYPFDYANGSPSLGKGLAFADSPCAAAAVVKVKVNTRDEAKATHPVPKK